MLEDLIIKDLQKKVTKLRKKNKMLNAEVRRLVTELNQKRKRTTDTDSGLKPKIKTEYLPKIEKKPEKKIWRCSFCGKVLTDEEEKGGVNPVNDKRYCIPEHYWRHANDEFKVYTEEELKQNYEATKHKKT